MIRARGSAGPKAGLDRVLEAKTTGQASAITTSIGGSSPDATIEAISGGAASFNSDMIPNEDGTLTESGVINFGSGNGFTFSTLGKGMMGPSADHNLTHGAIAGRWTRAPAFSTARAASSPPTSR